MQYTQHRILRYLPTKFLQFLKEICNAIITIVYRPPKIKKISKQINK